jgi:hypothetical protein
MRTTKKPARTANIAMRVEPWLLAKLTALAQDHGVTTNFVIRRALLSVILAGEVPWPEKGEEGRLREKWGEAAVPHEDITETLDVDEAEGQEPSEGEKPTHARLS